MASPAAISADMFGSDAIDPQTTAANAALVEDLKAAGWTFPPASVEALRDIFRRTPRYRSPRAETIRVPTPYGDAPARVLRSSDPTGVYMFCHPGGFVFGSADEHDAALERIARSTGMTALSVDYRLAPEHPYPAGLDDCEHVARWLLDHGAGQFGSDRLVVGGCSAGANLALCTMLRLREADGFRRIAGACLLYGNYDLTMTPSQRNADPERFLISTASLEWLYGQYVATDISRGDPDVSPLYADLSGLPATLLMVGTNDSLLDDTLFLACRLLRVQNHCALHLIPGGEHVFDVLDTPASREAVARMDAFLAWCVTDGAGP